MWWISFRVRRPRPSSPALSKAGAPVATGFALVSGLFFMAVIVAFACLHTQHDFARHPAPAPAATYIWTPPACEASAFPPNSASCVQPYDPNNQ